MSRWFKLLLVLTLTFGFAASLSAASLEEELTKMATENAKGYVGPLSTAFGTAMNSGLYQTAKTHPTLPSIPGFDVMVKFSLVQVSDAGTTYQFLMPVLPMTGMSAYDPGIPGKSIPDTINFDTNTLYPSRTVPTMFGTDKPDSLKADLTGVETMIENALLGGGWTASDIATLKAYNGGSNWNNMVNSVKNAVPSFLPPPGINITTLPMVMPQVALGLPFNSEFQLRMIPTFNVTDIGEISFLGVGVKHSISQWIPLCPVDISAQYMWQQLKVGSILESTHSQFNVHASKQFGFNMLNWTPYIGAGIESSSIDIKYTISAPNPSDAAHLFDGRTVSFNLPGDNKGRFTVGSRFILALIAIDANYSVGAYNSASLGVGFSFK